MVSQDYRAVIQARIPAQEAFQKSRRFDCPWSTRGEEGSMRKTFLFNMMTLDGFFAGPAGEIDWHHVDNEFMPKLVFSRTLQAVDWHNSRLAREDPEREVSRLKNDTGGPIAIFGSARLASAILSKGLLDEVRVMVNPVILGRGIPCFRTTPATGCIS